MTDFGTDIGGVDDLDWNITPVDDRTALAQALVRRITTPRGALWYAPDYGYDITAYINTSADPAVIESSAAGELLNDERVTEAETTLTVTDPDDGSVTGGKSWSLDVQVSTGDGPFEFTLSVDAVTGALLLSAVT